jgi:hypothetical protein
VKIPHLLLTSSSLRQKLQIQQITVTRTKSREGQLKQILGSHGLEIISPKFKTIMFHMFKETVSVNFPLF